MKGYWLKYMSENSKKVNMDNLAEEFKFYMLWGEYRKSNECKLSIKNKEDVILAVKKAYIDMTPRTITGLGLNFDNQVDIKKEYKKKIKEWINFKNEKIDECLQGFADEIIKEFNVCKCGEKDFNHDDLCEHFIKEYQEVLIKINRKIQENTHNEVSEKIDTGKVTYGKAQKILNMTCKYLMLFDDAKEYASVFEQCDMAVDSYVIAYFNDKVVAQGKKKIDTAWSNLDYTLYNNFQRDIKDYCATSNIESFTGVPLYDEFTIWHEGRKIVENNSDKNNMK